MTLPAAFEEVERLMSARRVDYDVDPHGVTLSVPAPTAVRQLQNLPSSTEHSGYDSDGEVGPFLDAIFTEEGIEQWDEDGMVPEGNVPNPEEPRGTDQALAAPADSNQQLLTEEEIKKMTVSKLKDELRA